VLCQQDVVPPHYCNGGRYLLYVFLVGG
jgi:hypothetical protein